MTDIYYIEDDTSIAHAVKDYLSGKDCHVCVFSTAASARQALLAHTPSIILIDWNLPDGEGHMLCRWVRSKWTELPVIMLTVRGDTGDVVAGFQYGADDYVVKPFELEVLYSRIGALLRRTGQVPEQKFSCGPVTIDQNRMTVYLNGREISVSQAEYQLLLLLLMINKGRTVTRERLLEQIWDSNGNYVNDNTLTVTMKRLREKLYQPSCLKTVRSFGYRMEDII